MEYVGAVTVSMSILDAGECIGAGKAVGQQVHPNASRKADSQTVRPRDLTGNTSRQAGSRKNDQIRTESVSFPVICTPAFSRVTSRDGKIGKGDCLHEIRSLEDSRQARPFAGLFNRQTQGQNRNQGAPILKKCPGDRVDDSVQPTLPI
jgi:hypothetical protein